MRNLTKFIVCGGIFLLLFTACTKDFEEVVVPQQEEAVSDSKMVVNSGVLAFTSMDELSNRVSVLKENDSFEFSVSPMTRTSSNEFISLRQNLIDQGLRSFSDAELETIMREELTYEPEDELITDPYLMAILNQNREVQIEDLVYRYVDEGMIVYPADMIGKIDDSISTNISGTSGLSHGQSLSLSSSVSFVKIDYLPSLSAVDFGNVMYYDDGSIELQEGIVIPKEKVKRTTYKQGNGDANWLQKGASNLFGTNVTLENKFNNNHRMKLRMYDQDYIIYRAVGMTVRMQKKVLGIWWRKKAQEFRYGWTAIECEYKYSKPVFSPPTSNNLNQPKYPTALRKKFPFADTDIVLFHIPLANYNVTSGNINAVVAAAMKKLANTIDSWIGDNGYKSNPRGLYTTHSNDEKVLVVYPAGEEVAYNDGREVVKWEMTWLSGNIYISFSNNLAGGGWKGSIKNFGTATKVTIKRGQVYAAVRYNNDWRACVIETGN